VCSESIGRGAWASAAMPASMTTVAMVRKGARRVRLAIRPMWGVSETGMTLHFL
jgi:hypothetical protein